MDFKKIDSTYRENTHPCKNYHTFHYNFFPKAQKDSQILKVGGTENKDKEQGTKNEESMKIENAKERVFKVTPKFDQCNTWHCFRALFVIMLVKKAEFFTANKKYTQIVQWRK